MNPNNQQTQPPQPPTRPVLDTSPVDSLGNPEAIAQIPVRQAPNEQSPTANPLMASRSSAPPPQAPSADDLDKVLKDVSKDVKASDKKPHRATKPFIAITVAVIVALALSAAAYYSYKASN